jgi:hypothetical protein
MLISSQAVPYFIAVFIAVTPGKLPEQGWVQMLRPFETREECLIELKNNERLYFRSVVNNFRNIIRRVHAMECMTEENINAINKEFGHPQDDDDDKEVQKIGV